jgi:hypothetical protein
MECSENNMLLKIDIETSPLSSVTVDIVGLKLMTGGL